MKIAYISGFGSTPNKDKIKIMEERGEVIYYDPNYLKNKEIIYTIAREISDVGDDEVFIVGSSLGAYMAFYVSNILQKPALLFNPSFNFKNGGKLISNHDRSEYPNKLIVLSKQDEMLDNKTNLKFLSSIGYGDKIIEIEGGHHIDTNVFKNHFEEFLKMYGDIFKKMSIEKKKKIRKSEEKTPFDPWITVTQRPRRETNQNIVETIRYDIDEVPQNTTT